MAVGYGCVLVLLLAAGTAEGQEIIHPERVGPLLARERIARDATRIRDIEREIAGARTPPGRRVELARERADLEERLRFDISLGRQVRITVEPAARDAWERLTGRSLDTLDGERRYVDCAELARREHVMSVAATFCRERAGEVAALPSPLYLAGYDAAFAEDHTGSESPTRYARAAAALARSPADRTLALALSAMQVVLRDHRAALATLRAIPATDYEAQLNRAVARAGLGRSAEAEQMLVELVRTAPDRPEAPYDLARLLTETGGLGLPPQEPARRALAALRMHLCHADRAMPGPADILTASAEMANELQIGFESPPNWSGGFSDRPVVPLDRLPVAMRGEWPADIVPMLDCAEADARGLAILLGTARDAAPPAGAAPGYTRAVAPPASSLVGPRPTFRWTGAGEARLLLCADAACRDVRREIRGERGQHRPAEPLAPGRWFWRVDRGPARPLWVARHARGVMRIPDVDCDGWPDEPLGTSGWYARFDGRGPPTLVAIPGVETSTAHALYAGDLDGDGCGDLAQPSGYALLLLYGSPGGPLAPREVVIRDPGLVWNVDWVIPSGDLDGDGFDDLVGDLNHPEMLFFGARAAAPRRQPPADPLAHAYEPAGDVNGDGFMDMAAWTNDFDTTTARWGFHRGGLRGVSEHAMTRIATGYSVRWDLVPVGDVDGDGFGDVLHWTPGNDDRDPPARWQLHRGSRDGPSARPSTSFTTRGPWSQVVPAGDVDGDGRDDVVLAADGRVFLRAGGLTGFAAPIDLGPWPDTASLHVVHMPDAEPATVWLLAPLSMRALRVERGRATEVTLTPP